MLHQFIAADWRARLHSEWQRHPRVVSIAPRRRSDSAQCIGTDQLKPRSCCLKPSMYCPRKRLAGKQKLIQSPKLDRSDGALEFGRPNVISDRGEQKAWVEVGVGRDPLCLVG